MRHPIDRVSRAGALAFGALVASAAWAACRPAGDGGAASSPIEYESFCDSYARMSCDAAEACDCLGGFGVEACLVFMGAECRDEYESHVEAGRSAFHPSEAGQCVAGLRGILSDCAIGDDEQWPEACDRVLTGLGGAGAECDGDDECAAPLECYDDRCVAVPGDGEPCLEGRVCGDDSFCGDDGLCHRERSRGAPCPEGWQACADDLYCDERTATCELYLSRGEACDHEPSACADELYCSDDSGTCRPYPGAGEPCADSRGICADGLYCDESESTCRRQGGAGAPCSDDEHCQSYDCTDGACEGEHDDGVCPF